MRQILFAALLISLPVRAELVDRVAAVVNRDVVALSEVEARAAPELQKAANDPDPTHRTQARADALKHALDALIGEKLMEAQLKELNIDVTDSEVDLAIDDVKRQNNNIDDAKFEEMLMQEGYSMATYKSFMKKHLARLKLVNLKVRSKVKVSDEDLKAEYIRSAKVESEDAEVHARHLLVSVAPKATAEQVESARKKALELMSEAKKPGTDFAALARKKSEGPSASMDGDLGFFRRGVMVPEFERAAFTLPVGGISEPIRTKFGWHVIKIEERRALAPKPYEEVRDQLRERLLRAQLEKYTEQYIQELRAQAVVEDKL